MSRDILEQRLVSQAMAILGGRTSKKKAAASRRNGKLGGGGDGRPRAYKPCPRYTPRAHQFAKTTDRCPCGMTRAEAKLTRKMK
jgi:hypothetical protein